MMHEPCGLVNPSASCMQNTTRCKKDFPKEYCNQTSIDKSGFVRYRRRNTGVTTSRQNVELDNGYVHFKSKYWRRRRRNKSSIGRLTYVHPASGVLFYQRMLLCHHTGCRSFPVIRTVNDIVYPTCRATCEALGLLEDDREWETTLQEAALTATPTELRTLFAHILTFCQVSDPVRLWKRMWKIMLEDIPYTSSILLNIPGLHIDDSDLEDYVLYELEGCLNHCSKSVTDFGLHTPPEHLMSVLRNRLLIEEKSYDRRLLAEERDQLLPKLNHKQLCIFNLIIHACLSNRQELVFVYGYGGTGKTFLWKTIIYALRCEGKIVLAVASSGIASLLLLAGRTAHSRFTIPLDPTDTTTNFTSKKSATRDEIIGSSVAKSYLWRHFKMHHLIENMRLNNEGVQEVDKERISAFAQWLLDIGNGQIVSVGRKVARKDNFCPKNDAADAINAKILSMLSCRTHTYISYDEALPYGHDGGEVELLYPKEYLNSLSFAGLPPHRYKSISKGFLLAHTVNNKRPKNTFYFQKKTVSSKRDQGNLPQSSVRKALFESNQETETSDLTKKAKHDN
nr:DNA helicase [Tanacetum cinerariifolium]